MKICNYFKNIVEEDISQEFRLKDIDETRNYFIEKIKRNKLITKNYKNVCIFLDYFDIFLFWLLQLLVVFQFLLFHFLICIPIGITSSALSTSNWMASSASDDKTNEW